MGLLPRREPKSQGEGFAETPNDARPEGPDQLQEALLGAARSARRESNSEIVSSEEPRPQEVEAVAEDPQLPLHGLDHLGVVVAEREHARAGQEVDEDVAVHILDIRTLRSSDRNRQATSVTSWKQLGQTSSERGPMRRSERQCSRRAGQS